MQMMYKIIYKALQEAGLDNEYEPQDYLNFFCLGNREIPDNNNIENPTGENTPQVFVFITLLSKLYVFPYARCLMSPDQMLDIG